jgi:hypothetical protein
MQETEETSILRVLVLICPDAQSECNLDNKDELLLETSTAYTVPPPAAVLWNIYKSAKIRRLRKRDIGRGPGQQSPTTATACSSTVTVHL